MLETLVAMSERIEDVGRRKEMYFQLLGGVIGTLTSSSAQQLFADSNSLLVSLEQPQVNYF
jgi:hypothetical protein